MLPVPHRHDFPVVGGRAHLQVGRQGRTDDREGVIAACGHRVGQALEDRATIVPDDARLPMADPRRGLDRPAVGRPDALMTEAHAERRCRGAELPQDVRTHAEIPLVRRTPGSRRQDDRVGREPPDFPAGSWRISIAGGLAAPLTVPAGNMAANASRESLPGASSPSTRETRCWTWLYRSTLMYCGTRMLPNRQTFPRSFRPRSTSMLCSALSFSSASNSRRNRSVSGRVVPECLVPAIGHVVAVRSSTRRSISGLAPITRRTPKSR